MTNAAINPRSPRDGGNRPLPRLLGRLPHALVALGLFTGLWTAAYFLVGQQSYLLPSPWDTAAALVKKADMLGWNGVVTASEILIGLLVGTVLGCASALLLASFTPLRKWVVPLLVMSQAVPVFAIAPLLVLWFGFGMASKVAMATIIIYFPITTTFLDGLRHTDPGWLDMARLMGGSRWRVLWYIRVPAALPHLASGLRVAAAVAPIGAIIGEWVGASAGLGYVMMQANARVQTDVMFAALLVLAFLAIIIYLSIHMLLQRMLPWVPRDGTLS